MAIAYRDSLEWFRIERADIQRASGDRLHGWPDKPSFRNGVRAANQTEAGNNNEGSDATPWSESEGQSHSLDEDKKASRTKGWRYENLSRGIENCIGVRGSANSWLCRNGRSKREDPGDTKRAVTRQTGGSGLQIIDWHSIGNLKSGMFQSPMYDTSQAETFSFWRTTSDAGPHA
jgi:hypothetical protein